MSSLASPAPDRSKVPKTSKHPVIEVLDALHQYGPETPGPLTVYTPSGVLLASDKPTLHQCMADLSRRVKEVVVTTQMRSKADAAAFYEVYRGYNRHISEGNVARLQRRMDTNDYPTNGITVSYDANGDPCDGGHSTVAFLRSNKATLRTVFALGLDPKLNTRRDTGMYRDLIAQSHYLRRGVLDDIEIIKEQRTFTTSVSQIFAMAAEHHLWDIKLRFSEARKEVCQHKVGMALVEACHDPFLKIRRMLQEAAEIEENNDVLLFKRLIFYVPAVILTLAGYPKWPEMLATGADTKADPLSKGSRWLLAAANRAKADDDEEQEVEKNGKKKKLEFATRREQSDNKHTIHTLLAFAYAKATKTDKIKLPLPRYVIDKDGTSRDVTGERTKEEIRDDNRFQREVAAFFMNKITNPLESIKG